MASTPHLGHFFNTKTLPPFILLYAIKSKSQEFFNYFLDNTVIEFVFDLFCKNFSAYIAIESAESSYKLRSVYENDVKYFINFPISDPCAYKPNSGNTIEDLIIASLS